MIPKPNKKLQARQSVSAEAFGRFHVKAEFKPKVIPKTPEQNERITKRLGQAFMFQALDDKEKAIVVKAMAERIFKAGQTVIKQGDDGDVLYVVDDGKLDCFKKFSKDAADTYLKTYVPGESFGELALLYNAPRAASIICKEDAVLFSLDRATFNHIVKDATVRREIDMKNS